MGAGTSRDTEEQFEGDVELGDSNAEGGGDADNPSDEGKCVDEVARPAVDAFAKDGA